MSKDNRSTTNVHVRAAVETDFEAVTHAVTSLLQELSGDSERTLDRPQETFGRLILGQNAQLGGVLVAEDRALGTLLGVITYSFGFALRTGGTHCTIQELWVSEAARHQGVGKLLISALEESIAGTCAVVEVGLPGATYPEIASTTDFYTSQGFTLIGTRAKKSLTV